jgi:translation initiation factor 3 subunit I
MQMSQDKTYFITASKDFTAKIIDSATLKEIKAFKTDRPVNSAALSPRFDQVP